EGAEARVREDLERGNVDVGERVVEREAGLHPAARRPRRRGNPRHPAPVLAPERDLRAAGPLKLRAQRLVEAMRGGARFRRGIDPDGAGSGERPSEPADLGRGREQRFRDRAAPVERDTVDDRGADVDADIRSVDAQRSSVWPSSGTRTGSPLARSSARVTGQWLSASRWTQTTRVQGAASQTCATSSTVITIGSPSLKTAPPALTTVTSGRLSSSASATSSH